MIEPIVVRFATAGIPEVRNAFAQVRTQAAKFEDGMVAAAEKGGRARIGLADREAREKMKAADKVAKDAEKAEREKTRSTEQEAKRRQEIVRRSSEMAGRDAVKAAREEAREIERIEEQKMRVRIRSSEMAGRAAAREAAEEIRAREQAAAASGRGATGYGKKWGGRIGGAAMAVGSVVGIGGAFALADAMRGEMRDEKIAAQLVNQVTTGAKPPDGANVRSILGQAGAVSRETGIDRGDITKAGLVYAQNARRGDFKGTMGNMGFIAKLSKVTGTNMNELAEAAGTLQSQNADLGPEQMQQLLLNAYAQSKQGSMSMTDAVKTIGIMGSTRSSFAGDVTANQRTLMGFGQIARAGGDAGEAGTFVKDIALEAGKADAKYFRETKKSTGKGEHLFQTDEHGRFSSPEDLVTSIIRKTGGNIQTINDLMGVRGGALFRELEGSYIQGAGKKNDVEAGINAVKANIREVTGATMTSGDLDAQFKQTMDQPAEKISSAMNKIQTEMENALAPALATFAEKLSDPAVERNIDRAIDAFGKIADYLLKNPLDGIGKIIAIAVTKDIASAVIGTGIKSVLMALLSGSGASGGGGIGAGAGALGKIGAAVGIAAGATAITVAGMSAYDAFHADKRDSAGRDIGSALGGVTDAGALARKAKSKTVTPADIAKMAAEAEAQKKVVDAKEAAMKGGPGIIATMVGAGADVAADQKAQYALQKAALDDMVKSLKAATAALAAMKASVPPTVPVPPVAAGSPAAPIGHDSRARAG